MRKITFIDYESFEYMNQNRVFNIYFTIEGVKDTLLITLEMMNGVIYIANDAYGTIVLANQNSELGIIPFELDHADEVEIATALKFELARHLDESDKKYRLRLLMTEVR